MNKRTTQQGYPCRTEEEIRSIHQFLWEHSDRRHLIVCNQKALATEFGTVQTRFHRGVNDLLAMGQLKVVAVGARGLKTYLVREPAAPEAR